MGDPRSRIPGIDVLLESAPFRPVIARWGRARATEAARAAVAEVREELAGGGKGPEDPGEPGAYARAAARILDASNRPSPRRVINATGVVLHTNLGRAPLAPRALDAVTEVARGYANLEYDLDAGERGSRYDHCAERLTRLTGAGGALVVNNNAAALVLALNEIARGRTVLVSRGELVEIGGGFRIPEILERSGARLGEVGTTNRTRTEDYARAADGEGEVAAILKVHRSNFRVEGFTEEAPLRELAGLAGERGIVLLHDLGSGLLVDPARLGLPPEPRAGESLAAGADLVTMSGDKLLGGPQAGIVAGREELVARMRRNPLCRAFRVDKLTLAALDVTLRLHEEPGEAVAEIPALRMLAAAPEELGRRARELARRLAKGGLGSEVREGSSAVGGGAFPAHALPTRVVALTGSPGSPDATARRLRSGEPPVVGRIDGGAVVLDPRTVDPDEEDALVRSILASLGFPDADGGSEGDSEGEEQEG